MKKIIISLLLTISVLTFSNIDTFALSSDRIDEIVEMYHEPVKDELPFFALIHSAQTDRHYLVNSTTPIILYGVERSSSTPGLDNILVTQVNQPFDYYNNATELFENMALEKEIPGYIPQLLDSDELGAAIVFESDGSLGAASPLYAFHDYYPIDYTLMSTVSSYHYIQSLSDTVLLSNHDIVYIGENDLSYSYFPSGTVYNSGEIIFYNNLNPYTPFETQLLDTTNNYNKMLLKPSNTFIQSLEFYNNEYVSGSTTYLQDFYYFLNLYYSENNYPFFAYDSLLDKNIDTYILDTKTNQKITNAFLNKDFSLEFETYSKTVDLTYIYNSTKLDLSNFTAQDFQNLYYFYKNYVFVVDYNNAIISSSDLSNIRVYFSQFYDYEFLAPAQTFDYYFYDDTTELYDTNTLDLPTIFSGGVSDYPSISPYTPFETTILNDYSTPYVTNEQLGFFTWLGSLFAALMTLPTAIVTTFSILAMLFFAKLFIQ